MAMFACRTISELLIASCPQFGAGLLQWLALTIVGAVRGCGAPVAERKKGVYIYVELPLRCEGFYCV